jgi:hypothetical protein
MQPENILEDVMEYLQHHVEEGQGLPWQEPYKGKLFRLFEVAYEQGLTSQARLTGDSIRDVCIDRWRPSDDPHGQQLLHLIGQVSCMWREWGYALDHYRR